MDPEKYHIRQLLNKGTRLDGRGPIDYREISIEKGIIETASGSARVKIGDTEVVAGIKISAAEPFADTPDEGVLTVNVELLPLSSPRFEPGPPKFEAIELARVVDRGIRESHAVDMKKLAIGNGKVWMISIDVISINAAGNLFDACGLAAIAAIQDAKLPTVNGDEIDYKTKSDQGLPINELPIPITVLRIGDHYVADPTAEEETAYDDRLTSGILEDGRICSMQKGGDDSITLEDIDKMVEIAILKSSELRKHL